MDFLPLMDVISHLEDQWPMDDMDVLLRRFLYFFDGLVMIGDELEEIDGWKKVPEI